MHLPAPLPGFAGDPLRVTVDLTWWPSDDTFQISERTWMKDAETQVWRLEAMTVHPVQDRKDVPERLSVVLTAAWSLLSEIAGARE